MGEDKKDVRFGTPHGGTVGRVNNATPLWVYGEDGIEIPIPFADEPISMDTVEIDIDHLRDDKKMMWTLKWGLLKTALKFFFTGKLR